MQSLHTTDLLESIHQSTLDMNAITLHRYKIKQNGNDIDLIYTHYHGKVSEQEVVKWSKSMVEINQQSQKFIVITDNTHLEHFDQEGRKHQVLWFKQQKETLSSRCLGIIRIARDDLQAERLNRPQMQKAFPCPLLVVGNLEEALLEAKALRFSCPVA